MNIIIDGQTFIFSDDSEIRIEAGGCDLYITEPSFDKSSEKKIEHFTSKPIILPYNIERGIKRTREVPCSKIFKDANGKLRLYTYFD